MNTVTVPLLNDVTVPMMKLLALPVSAILSWSPSLMLVIVVLYARLDGKLLALDQQTGGLLWAASNSRYLDGYTMTMAPLYYNGLVIVGVSGGEYGARGSVTAYDARDGHLAWRFYTVPAPGQTGADTWPANDEWRTGGAPVWNTPSVDPKLGLLYVTTGNAYPWSTRAVCC